MDLVIILMLIFSSEGASTLDHVLEANGTRGLGLGLGSPYMLRCTIKHLGLSVCRKKCISVCNHR